jgi:HPt (histidine-containing phosphotransfer) domain-containing protein
MIYSGEMQYRHINEPDTIDGQLLCSVAVTLGVSRLAELLVVFEARIGSLAAALVALPGDRASVLATLHQSRGSAASLGFTKLQRVLADIELRLGPKANSTAYGLPGIDAPEIETPLLSYPAAAAVGVAWQASLTSATLHIPELRHHMPCGSKR